MHGHGGNKWINRCENRSHRQITYVYDVQMSRRQASIQPDDAGASAMFAVWQRISLNNEHRVPRHLRFFRWGCPRPQSSVLKAFKPGVPGNHGEYSTWASRVFPFNEQRRPWPTAHRHAGRRAKFALLNAFYVYIVYTYRYALQHSNHWKTSDSLLPTEIIVSQVSEENNV